MAKDPAFLFYPNDWLGGTMTFTRAHKGAYMDLLMCQFNHGRMKLQDIKDVLGSDYESMWESKLKSKFKVDNSGNFFSERLEFEKDKRKNFTKSRRDNLKTTDNKDSDMNTHTSSRMENENENRNENTIEHRRRIFNDTVILISVDKNFPQEMTREFISYWTEHNQNGKKMRFEMQKVFDIGRRLGTWQRNNKNFNKQNHSQDAKQQRSDLQQAALDVLAGNKA